MVFTRTFVKTITAMKSIDLKKLMQERDIPSKEMADLLFPSNKYPAMALTRVLKGEAYLDTVQISNLADFLSVDFNDLFSQKGWSASFKNRVHVFKNGNYSAILNMETGQTKIMHGEAVFHEEILHSLHLPLSDYFKLLNDNISKFEK